MSTSQPCGDLTCMCCHPEMTCWCSDRPMYPDPGDTHVCPRCGDLAEAVAHDDLPERVRERVERSKEIIRAARARNGRTLPPQPETLWRSITGPTKPGPYR